MTRADRVFVPEGVYHVFNRLARGERAFDEQRHAKLFVDLVRDVAKRDELTVLAWCLMSNHYHLAVRTGAVPLERPIRSLQQRVTRGVNLRRGVWGPLWQGRYRAKLIADETDVEKLLVYIHLNPVTAGMVSDPVSYRWSGHRELLGRVSAPVTHVDEVLALFGDTRRRGRAAYLQRVEEGATESWSGEEPERLPWWRLGRPGRGDEEDPESALRDRRGSASEGPGWRPRLTALDFLARGAGVLAVPLSELQGRQRGRRVVSARELLALLGAERYGLRVKDLAGGLRQSPDSVSKAIGRASRRRAEDGEYRLQLDELDTAVVERSSPLSPSNGGMA